MSGVHNLHGKHANTDSALIAKISKTQALKVGYNQSARQTASCLHARTSLQPTLTQIAPSMLGMPSSVTLHHACRKTVILHK